MATPIARALLVACATALVPQTKAELVVHLNFNGQSLTNLGTAGGSASVEGTSVLSAGTGFGGSDGLRGNSAGSILFSSSNFINYGNFTLSTRVKRGSTADWQNFWGLGLDSTFAGNVMRMEDTGTGIDFYEDGPGPYPGIGDSANYEDNVWHNFVVTASGGTGGVLQLYVDGVLRATSNNGYAQNISVLRLLSNSYSGNRRQNSNAYVDDVLAFNYGLGATHAAHLGNLSSSSLASAGASDWVHVGASSTLASGKTVAGLYASADVVLNSGVTLTVSSGNVRLAGRNHWVQGGGSITSGTSTLTLFQDDTALTDVSLNGAGIVDNGSGAVSVVKNEAGLIRFRSRQAYTGSTTVNAGTLRLEHGAAGLGTSASRTYVVNGGTLQAAVTDALAEDATLANTVNLNAGGTFLLSGGSNTVGTLDLGVSGTAGTASVSLTSTDAAGALVLAGAAPTLRVRAAASGSTLSGAGFVAAKGANLTLDVANGSAAVDFTAASALRSAAGSSVALVKSGAGRARLSAAGNNFAGGIRVDAGILELASGATSTSALTVNGGTLVVNGSATAGLTTVTSGTLMGSGTLGAVTVASGAVFSPGNSPGKLTTGNLTYASGSIIELEASDFTSTASANPVVNDYIVSTGTVSFGANPVNIRLFGWDQAQADRGAATVFSDSFGYTYEFLTAAGGISYNGSSTFDSSLFALDVSGLANLYSGTWALVGDSTKLSLVYTPATVVVTVDVAAGQTLGAASSDLATIAADNAFAKTGAGTLTVSSAYAFSGGSSVNAGTVRLSGSGVLGSAAILVASGAALELESGVTFSNQVTGTGSVAKVGAGSLTLASLDAAANAVSVSGGTLALTGSSSVGSLAAAAGGALDLSGSTSVTVSGALSATGGTATVGGSVTAGSVTVSAGTLNLAAGSVSAGNVTVSGGTLALGASGTLAASGTLSLTGGSMTVAAGSTLSYGALSLTGGTLTGNFGARNTSMAVGAGGTVVLNDTGTLTTTASFSGAGTVAYSGGGTLTLGAASALTGTLRVTSGLLKGSVGGSFGAGTVEVASGGAVDLAGIDRGSNPFNLVLAGTGVSNSGALYNSGSVIWGNSGIVNVTLAGSATVTVGGSGEGNRFDLRETGTLNLGGHTLTKRGGGLLVVKSTPGTAGTIDIAEGNLSSEVNFSGSASANFSVIVRSGAGFGAYDSRSVQSAVTLDGTSAAIFSLGGARSTFSNVILQGGGRYDNGSRVYGAGDGLVVSGMSGTGNFVVSGGSMALYALGNWNFTSGQVSVIQLNAGYIETSGGALTTNAVLEIGSGANGTRAVDLWSGNMTVRGLSGGTSSTRIVSNNNQRVIVDTPAGETYTYSGVLANSTWASSWMGLTKNGAGTQVLAGTVTTSASTNVNGGVLRLTGSMSDSANTTNRALSVATLAGSTATFEVAGGTLTYGGAAGINIGDAGNGTFTLSSGAVSVGTEGVWLGDSSSSASGTLNVSGGTFTSAGGLVVATRGSGAVNLTGGTTTFTTVQLGHAAGSGQTATVTLGGGTLVSGGFSRAAGTGNLLANGGTIRASASSSSYLQGLSLAEIRAGGLTLDTNGFDITVAQDLLASGVSPGGGLTKVGAGVLTLSGANTYAGGTTLSAGTLRLGSGSALGTGAVTVASGATLDLNGQTFANALTLQSGAVMVGSGTLSASSAALDFAGAAPSAQASLAVSGSGSISFGSTSYSGNVTYAGGTVTGAGFGGYLVVSGANVALGASAGAGTVRLTAGHGATIGAGFARDIRYEGGTLGGLSAAGYTGTVTVAGGSTLDIDGAGAISSTSAAFSVLAGSTLKGTGTFSSAVTVAGTLAPGNSPGLMTYESGLTLGATSVLAWEFDAGVETASNQAQLDLKRGVDYDAIDVTGGALTIATGAQISILAPASYDYTANFWDTLRVFRVAELANGATISGQLVFADQSSTQSVGGEGQWDIVGTYAGNPGVFLQWSPVPEPSTYGLALGGLALAAAALRRRQRGQAARACR